VKAIKSAIMGVSGVEGASGGGSKKIRKKKTYSTTKYALSRLQQFDLKHLAVGPSPVP